ncbi:fructokinase-like 1, partial [Striga asiatica]
MATLQLAVHHRSHSFALNPHTAVKLSSSKTQFPHKLRPPKSSSGETPSAPRRRGSKKSTPTASPPSPSSSKKKPKRHTKADEAPSTPTVPDQIPDAGDELYDFDDGIDFPYEDPPLLCCIGAARKEFLPTVRVSEDQMHPDMYSQWKMLQWDPPEFARAPGGPPSNVAISHARLGGRAAFIGKVGRDGLGEELVLMMNKEKVQTRGVKFDESSRTACSHMKIRFDEGKMLAEMVKECAEDSLLGSELNLSVLKEVLDEQWKLSYYWFRAFLGRAARMLHLTSDTLTSPSTRSALLRAIAWSKKFGALTFFDPNLSLPLWKSRDETRAIIKPAWDQADIIEVTRQELEFLLDEPRYQRIRNYKPQYYAESYEEMKSRRNFHHYTREEIEPLWHDGLKLLFVTDGTLRVHYYSPVFDGVAVGTEDVLITPFTCDRTGSGDAVVAGIMRKLMICHEMFEDKDVLERNLRFAISAGIIAQWTIGGVRGMPTESAAQNLKEQVYVPSMW